MHMGFALRTHANRACHTNGLGPRVDPSQLGKYVYVVSADGAAEKIVSRGPWAIDITGLVETDCDQTATCRRSARLADRAEASSGFRRDMKEPRLGHLCRSVCK